MPRNHRVIWSEGMFLRPQHFQQHDRYIEALVEGRSCDLRAFGWGFATLAVDSGPLAFGKFALTECRGIFPDGTPFDLPHEDDLPVPLDLGEEARGRMIYLCLPHRALELAECEDSAAAESLSRFRRDELEVRDNRVGPEADVEVGRLRTRLMLESSERGGYVCLGVARVLEVTEAKLVRLDPGFIPPALNCIGTGSLGVFLRELNGILKSRAEALASVVTGVEKLVAEESSHLLALQVINRYQPLFSHLDAAGFVHPEELFRLLLQLAGELSTLYRLPARRPIEYPAYRHDDLKSSFGPLIDELRQLLMVEVERHAFQIPLEQLKPGAYRALRPDPLLLESAVFVLAAKAELSAQTIIAHLPNQVKIAPLEDIQYLINQALPGFVVRPLPHVPQHIPRHAGFCYFEVEKHSPLWRRMAASAGFAIHIGGSFPGLELEFWATTKT